MPKRFAIYTRESIEIVNGKWVRVKKPERVRVIVEGEGYAMVRHPRAMPFVVSLKDLSPDAGA